MLPGLEELGTKITDISYGDEEANKFDLYLPKDSTKDTYGLVIYLHAGGFTSGDKADDENMLAWLCSKGYVAAGINYTLRTDTNNASVLLQSNEIKEVLIVADCENRGYNIDKMTVAGGSAGHALAMIYAYRDAQMLRYRLYLLWSCRPILFLSASFFFFFFLFFEDWGVYGLDQNTEESRIAAANLFSVMGGVEITPEEIQNGSYTEKMKPISAAEWVSENCNPNSSCIWYVR